MLPICECPYTHRKEKIDIKAKEILLTFPTSSLMLMGVQVIDDVPYITYTYDPVNSCFPSQINVKFKLIKDEEQFDATATRYYGAFVIKKQLYYLYIILQDNGPKWRTILPTNG